MRTARLASRSAPGSMMKCFSVTRRQLLNTFRFSSLPGAASAPFRLHTALSSTLVIYVTTLLLLREGQEAQIGSSTFVQTPNSRLLSTVLIRTFNVLFTRTAFSRPGSHWLGHPATCR